VALLLTFSATLYPALRAAGGRGEPIPVAAGVA
jgi:hypothetical protein